MRAELVDIVDHEVRRSRRGARVVVPLEKEMEFRGAEPHPRPLHPVLERHHVKAKPFIMCECCPHVTDREARCGAVTRTRTCF